MTDAINFVRLLESRQGVRICCPEEVAYRMGFIGRSDVHALGEKLGKSEYGKYLMALE
jgi:glucose-1-phosphate thymidylyltransferase